MNFDGKVALVTGGTSGIGAATAKAFANLGARVILTGRSVEKGQTVAAEIGGAATFYEADVTKESDIERSVIFAQEKYGQLDIVFNNAGSMPGITLEKLVQDDIGAACTLLLGSMMLSTKYAAAAMQVRGGGVIINNASIAAHRYGQGDILYSSLKAAVLHFTRLAAVDLAPHRIRVNSVSPGAIATPIFWGGSERANQLSDDENAYKFDKLTRNLKNAVPLREVGTPEDIAQAVLYLASDAAKFVTGHDLVVDGGRIAMFNETQG